MVIYDISYHIIKKIHIYIYICAYVHRCAKWAIYNDLTWLQSKFQPTLSSIAQRSCKKYWKQAEDAFVQSQGMPIYSFFPNHMLWTVRISFFKRYTLITENSHRSFVTFLLRVGDSKLLPYRCFLRFSISYHVAQNLWPTPLFFWGGVNGVNESPS